MKTEKKQKIHVFKPTPEDFAQLRDPNYGEQLIKDLLKQYEENDSALHEYLKPWYRISKEAKFVYPSQGLLTTPHDYLDYQSFQMLPQEKIVKTLRMRRFFLEMYNHPYRIAQLDKVNKSKFIPVPKVESKVMDSALKNGLALAIGDLGAQVVGAGKERVSRTDRYSAGPFVKLGRQARTYFVGSASPDVWNSTPAIATMAASHCLACIPRNGLTYDIQRQTDLAVEVFVWLDRLADQILTGRKDKAKVLKYWKNNVMGALEANPEKALVRAKALYKVGVRVFRVYSPEPGVGPIETVKALRKKYGNEIEIFSGQLVGVEQAKLVEEAGADGVFVGIGGGGRCITGVRSGSVIDWPELVWKLRGEINIPIVVEGGASDHVAVTLLLGATGIGVSRVVSGGTIESPGGALYATNGEGKLFKPYGGEASARTKYVDGKTMPFGIPTFVEGETTKAQMSYVKYVHPTLTYNLHLLIEDAILALVFRGSQDIHELQAINPSPLRRNTSIGEFQKNTH